MKTIKLELTEKELNLIMDGLYKRWSLGTLEENPKSKAAELLNRLYDLKHELKTLNK
tara:strand:+ start:431 stop:601 length:171 start_codon:yes stop_codon:yes gene_type:complete